MLRGQPALDDSGTGLSGESSEVPWEPEWGLGIWLGDGAGFSEGQTPDVPLGGREEILMRFKQRAWQTWLSTTPPPPVVLSQWLLPPGVTSLPLGDLDFQPPHSYASLHPRVYPSRFCPFLHPQDFSSRALEPTLSSRT